MTENDIALNALFPNTIKPFRQINLDDLMRQHYATPIKQTPAGMQRIINDHDMRNRCTSYGGWMENRAFTWHGTYLEKQNKPIHLGVDINITAGTPVHTPFDAIVLEDWTDPDREIGWGRRITVEPLLKNAPPFIFAHLARDFVMIPTYTPGQHIKHGETLGYIGTWPENGNVFQHLHLQAVNHTFFYDVGGLSEIDGYLKRDEEMTRQCFPEPLAEIAKIIEEK